MTELWSKSDTAREFMATARSILEAPKPAS